MYDTRIRTLLELVDTNAPGTLEVAKIDYRTAKAYADSRINGNIEDLIPNFADNFRRLKALAGFGWTQRKDMPRIRRADVWLLQQRLLGGALDIRKPFAPETNGSNPFPEGLSGEQAELFVAAGFRDGSLSDDKVKVKKTSQPAKDLMPIQRQIYYDKCIGILLGEGIETHFANVKNTLMVISNDKYIIDGHHRWAATILAKPTEHMIGIMVDLPIDLLLKVTLAYGDAIGNKRNL